MPTGGGGGGGGLSSVTTNATLTGAGTGVSPLSVAGSPLTYYQAVGNTTTSVGLTLANQVYISGFVLNNSTTFSKLGVHVNIADAVNNSDVGIYNPAGTLLANIGATVLGSTGFIATNTLQGSLTLAPGRYVFALTGNANNLKIDATTAAYTWISNTNVASSAGGVLPASIGALAISVTQGNLQFWLQ